MMKGDKMYCCNCGQKMAEDAQFCHFCGSKVKEQQKEIQQNLKEGEQIWEDQEYNDDKYVFRAYRKIGRFWFSPIDTVIHIHNNQFLIETNFHGKVIKKEPKLNQFSKKDIVNVKATYVPILYFIDIIRIVIGALLLFTGIYGVVVLTLFVFITLTRAISINLENGDKVIIFYQNSNEIQELLNKLQA